ncbi:hypothetical protein QBC46DRAFT_254595, partial [Diplogelasinospora grovesii]
PFIINNGLLYNIRADKTKSLYIPHVKVKLILKAAHDVKHHFGRDKMLYNLRGFITLKKKKRI